MKYKGITFHSFDFFLNFLKQSKVKVRSLNADEQISMNLAELNFIITQNGGRCVEIEEVVNKE